jgi:hypothetical protein
MNFLLRPSNLHCEKTQILVSFMLFILVKILCSNVINLCFYQFKNLQRSHWIFLRFSMIPVCPQSISIPAFAEKVISSIWPKACIFFYLDSFFCLYHKIMGKDRRKIWKGAKSNNAFVSDIDYENIQRKTYIFKCMI